MSGLLMSPSRKFSLILCSLSLWLSYSLRLCDTLCRCRLSPFSTSPSVIVIPSGSLRDRINSWVIPESDSVDRLISWQRLAWVLLLLSETLLTLCPNTEHPRAEPQSPRWLSVDLWKWENLFCQTFVSGTELGLESGVAMVTCIAPRPPLPVALRPEWGPVTAQGGVRTRVPVTHSGSLSTSPGQGLPAVLGQVRTAGRASAQTGHMPSGPSLWWPDRALRLWDLGRQIPAPLSGLTQDPRPARPREEPCPPSVSRSASSLCPGAGGLCPPSLGSLRLLLPRREGCGTVPHDRPPFLNGSEAVDSCVRSIRELSHACAGPRLLPAAHPSHEHPLEPRGKTW